MTRKLNIKVVAIALSLLLTALWVAVPFFNAQAERQANVAIENQLENPLTENNPTQQPKKSNVSYEIAFELFVRTVADGNARGLVKKIGLNDRDGEKLYEEAKFLGRILGVNDVEIQRRRNGNKKYAEIKNQILPFKLKQKNEISHALNVYLKNTLSADGLRKFQNFINSEVKGNIQDVAVQTQGKNYSTNPFVKAKHQNNLTPAYSSVHLYTAAWKDGTNVYGSGTVLEDDGTDASYQITTNVQAPNTSERQNTTVSDWGYSSFTTVAGLSIGADDGTYNVSAKLEQDYGTYDQYGNFQGSGSSTIATSPSSENIPKFVRLLSVRNNPNPVMQTTGNSNNVYQNSNVELDLLVSNGVTTTEGINLEMQLLQIDKSSSAISYEVTPLNRIQPRFNVSEYVPGENVRSNVFVMKVSSSPDNGTITSILRIESATNNSGTTLQDAAQESKEFILTMSNPTPTPTPTASPTPTGTAGMCNGSPDWTTYPSTGCSSGFVNNNGMCTRSNNFIRRCDRFGGYDSESCGCLGDCTLGGSCSPILLDISGDGFDLTAPKNGVTFDLHANGSPISKLSWTSRGDDDAWLALDRNDNNTIDNGKELFGNATPQPAPPKGIVPNGFIALAEYDKNAKDGKEDGKITRKDRIFSKLRLWQDKNHNGVSEPEELFTLPALDVVAIFLDYKESKRTDANGNRFLYRAKIRDAKDAKAGRFAFDVFLKSAK